MTVNVGTIDRTVRAVAGALLVVAWPIGWTTGTLAVVLGIVGVALLATAAVGVCPAYRLLGVNTRAAPRR